MGRILLLAFFLSFHFISHAGSVTGSITDQKGEVLSFASIIVKGTTRGAVANSQGRYHITLDPGKYTLVCQYVGYRSVEKQVEVTDGELTLNFQLSLQELTMDEVIIRKGEDPAIEIMRQTIKKRKFYNEQVDSFIVEVYIKGLMRSRAMPDRFMGQKIDKSDMAKDGIDSAGKGILFLSESVTKVHFTKPDNIKYEVLSSRQSGGGYGLDFPFFINFYDNNVQLINTNPRGFISPVSENAFHYYKFHYEGNFFEGNRMIDRIRVTPRRNNEPLFEGFIQIVDGEWRIHSLELMTLKKYSLELIDTLKITQIHSPVDNEVWRTSNQVVYLAAKIFGFDMAGNFLNVYSDYNLNPGFAKKHFNRILMSYDSTADKKDSSYWASIRPVPLEAEEKRNFVFKDSVSRYYRDSFSRLNRDSLNKVQKPIKFVNLLWGSGATRTHYGANGIYTWHLNSQLKELEYNSVEGVVMKLVPSLNIRPRKSKYSYLLGATARYGFSNEHLTGFGRLRISQRTLNFRNRYLEITGGSRVSQFNPDNPIDPLTNALYTLLAKKNYMKLYQNSFGSVEYNNRFESGIRLNTTLTWEHRIPLVNTTDYSFFKKNSVLLPNHPYELADIPFNEHEALIAGFTLSYQPGQRYIQYPRYKMPIGSKYPTFELQYSKGIDGWVGSDVDFDKWKFSVYDNLNLRMGGTFMYRISAGGFLNNNKVEIPDFQHFNGNQTFYNIKYLNSFQLAPYYQYSNTEKIFGLLHVEHHFNGLLTNKIPLFNKLKWNLVGGSNTFYVNRNNYYVEAFAGLENIFKMFRVDFVWAYQPSLGNQFGIRIGLGGIIGGNASISQ